MTNEERKQYNAIYYENNKHKIADVKSARIQCKCGNTIAHGGLARHLRSKVHFNNLKQVAEEQAIMEHAKKKMKKLIKKRELDEQNKNNN